MKAEGRRHRKKMREKKKNKERKGGRAKWKKRRREKCRAGWGSSFAETGEGKQRGPSASYGDAGEEET